MAKKKKKNQKTESAIRLEKAKHHLEEQDEDDPSASDIKEIQPSELEKQKKHFEELKYLIYKGKKILHIKFVIIFSFFYMIGSSYVIYDGIVFGNQVVNQLKNAVNIANTNNTLFISLDIGLKAGGEHIYDKDIAFSEESKIRFLEETSNYTYVSPYSIKDDKITKAVKDYLLEHQGESFDSHHFDDNGREYIFYDKWRTDTYSFDHHHTALGHIKMGKTMIALFSLGIIALVVVFATYGRIFVISVYDDEQYLNQQVKTFKGMVFGTSLYVILQVYIVILWMWFLRKLFGTFMIMRSMPAIIVCTINAIIFSIWTKRLYRFFKHARLINNQYKRKGIASFVQVE